MSRKRKWLLAIPLLIIGGFLINTWAVILFTSTASIWSHYTSLVLFAFVIFLFFKKANWAVWGCLLFLILGSVNFLTLTPSVYSFWFDIFGFKTPPLQPLSFGLLIFFTILNMDTMIDLYLDYKELKNNK